MPARLVYAPKVYVYTEQQSGAILDLSQFVVSGEVARKINQVSTASVVLRNPHRQFTSPNSSDGVAFHPMDPITIYMERIKDYPIRVFTGYLDTTPYYQLYPQTITLQASCTLKRLLYTYFDPALPYMYAFFQKYGWTNTGDGTLKNLNVIGTGNGKTLGDSSFGKILWAVLYDIGQWQDSNIYIENLPGDLPKKIAALSVNLKTAEDAAVKDFEMYLTSVIGYGTQGSGGGLGNSNSSGTGAPISGTSGQVPTTPANGYTPNTWAQALLISLGAPVNVPNLTALVAWEAAEGGNWNNTARFNPLNTTQPMPGAGNTGSQGNIKVYTSWEQGLQATVTTLRNGNYPHILSDIMAGHGDQIGGESEMSTWGTGSFNSNPSQKVQPPTAARGTQSNHAQRQSSTTTQAGHTARPRNAGANTGTGTTRIDVMVSAAATIANRNFPYAWGGGHEHAGTPSTHPPHSDGSGTPVLGFDCSGAVGAVLSAANLIARGTPVNSSESVSAQTTGTVPGEGTGTPEVTLFANTAHIFMRINGRMWGTGANGAGGPGWHDHTTSGFTPTHIPMNILNELTTTSLSLGGSGGTLVTAPHTTSMPLPASCFGPKRQDKDIKLIILHDSEIAGGGGYFTALSNTLKTQPRIGVDPTYDPPGTGLSVQIGVNADGSAVRLCGDDVTPFQAVHYNRGSLGIEQAGFSTFSASQWPAAQTQTTAQQIAYWAQKYSIPIVKSTTHGVCAHSDLGVRGGNHNDPGPGYPFDAVLTQAQTILNQAVTTGGGAGGGGGTGNDAAAAAYTNAFVAQIEGPSVQDMVTATTLGALHMGLMHDQSLLPFVQQLAQASMRSFQSLPNGDFYAFYPDYFGEFGHRDPYWLIDDIEILNGEIQLTDDALATHVFVIGDTTWPLGSTSSTGVDLNMMRAGTIDIQNAFGDTGILSRGGTKSPVMSADEAVQFIKRYGARPLVGQYPMIRSMEFEMFAAYEQFMLAWSNQFKTPFAFTFMPELYPGGKVGFPDHGLKMYISSVTHSWDYSEAGFTTTAELSAPSTFGNNTQDVPPNMVEAMIEPIKKSKKAKTDPPTVQATVRTIIDQTAQQVETAAQSIMNVIDSPTPVDQNPAQTKLNQIVQGL